MWRGEGGKGIGGGREEIKKIRKKCKQHRVQLVVFINKNTDYYNLIILILSDNTSIMKYV